MSFYTQCHKKPNFNAFSCIINNSSISFKGLFSVLALAIVSYTHTHTHTHRSQLIFVLIFFSLLQWITIWQLINGSIELLLCLLYTLLNKACSCYSCSNARLYQCSLWLSVAVAILSCRHLPSCASRSCSHLGFTSPGLSYKPGRLWLFLEENKV